MSSEPGQLDPSTDRTARLSLDVHRQLLTIQYQLKMAGESVSFNEIIRRGLRLLEKADAT